MVKMLEAESVSLVICMPKVPEKMMPEKLYALPAARYVFGCHGKPGGTCCPGKPHDTLVAVIMQEQVDTVEAASR